MGLIALPQRLLAQPQYAATIGDEFRAYNPKIVVLPASALNIANSALMGLVNGATSSARSVYFPGSGSYLDLGAIVPSTAGELSFVLVSKLDSFPTNFPTVFGCQTSEGSQFGAFYSNYSVAGYRDFSVGTVSYGGVASDLSGFGSVTGTLHQIVYTQSSTSVSNLWVNGQSLVRKAPEGIGLGTGTAVLGQQGSTSTTYGFNGNIYLFALFQRKLPDSIAAELSQNPWKLFRATPRRIFAVPAGGATSYTLTAASGSLAISGQAATLKAARLLLAGSGSLAISGQTATLKLGRVVSASAGSLAISGQAASLLVARLLSAASGSFAITGSDVTLTKSSAGAYTLTADSGSISISGKTAGLVATRILSVSSGSVSISGTAAALKAVRVLVASSGSILIRGSDATLTYVGINHYSLLCGSGSLDIVGSPVALRKSGGNQEVFAGGYGIYRSKEEREAYTRKQRIALGIIKDDPESVSAVYDEILAPKAKHKKIVPVIPIRAEAELEQENKLLLNAEIKFYLDLELEREEAAIIKLLMEM